MLPLALSSTSCGGIPITESARRVSETRKRHKRSWWLSRLAVASLNTIPASCHPPCAEAAVASRSATACSSTLLNEPAKIDWLPPLVGC